MNIETHVTCTDCAHSDEIDNMFECKCGRVYCHDCNNERNKKTEYCDRCREDHCACHWKEYGCVTNEIGDVVGCGEDHQYGGRLDSAEDFRL